MKVLVTGSSGLIGSAAVMFFDKMGFAVHGVDNNMWADFFGSRGDTTWSGNGNAASLLECVELIAEASDGKRPNLTYSDQNRIGDHICYYSDLRKLRSHYPDWELT